MRKRIWMVALAFVPGCGGVLPVAPTRDRIASRDFAAEYVRQGEAYLKRKEYVKAWNEFAVIADRKRLRAVLVAMTAGDFKAATFEEMLVHLVRAHRQAEGMGTFPAGLDAELEAAAAARLRDATDQDRFKKAWGIYRALWEVKPERKVYLAMAGVVLASKRAEADKSWERKRHLELEKMKVK